MALDLTTLDKEWTEEDEAFMVAYCEDVKKKQLIKEKQIQRFHEKYSHRFSEIIEKILAKYATDEYYYRWTRRGIEPEEYLLYFIFEYLMIYGQELSKTEYIKYSNDFTSAIRKKDGYVVQIMYGQGSAIRVDKIKS